MKNGAEPEQPRRHRAPGLKASMACEAAFRAIARHCVEDLDNHRPAAARRNRDALHAMRVALTRLRSAISLFSPMVVDPEQVRLKAELKWLNGVLGTARDLDVAIDQLTAIRSPPNNGGAGDRAWHQLHDDSHRRLARALGSPRYRRLIDNISHWIEDGAWSRSELSAKRRATSLARHGTRKLKRWHGKLLRAAKDLEHMGEQRMHRLRRRSKRLRYSIEFLADLLQEDCSRSILKHLRKAQSSLGEINAAARRRTIAGSLGVPVPEWFDDEPDRKRERRLIRAAAQAYRKMPELTFKETAVSTRTETTPYSTLSNRSSRA